MLNERPWRTSVHLNIANTNKDIFVINSGLEFKTRALKNKTETYKDARFGYVTNAFLLCRRPIRWKHNALTALSVCLSVCPSVCRYVLCMTLSLEWKGLAS